MSTDDSYVGVPGADPNLPTLAGTWVLASIPAPEIVGALVDAFGETMRVPIRRFTAHDERLRDAPSGSWLRNREKAIELLRHGYKGEEIIYFSVSSWNHGGYNWYPESEVRLHSDPETHNVIVQCERIVTDDDDVDSIAAAWLQIAKQHLDVIEEPAPPFVGRRRNGKVVPY